MTLVRFSPLSASALSPLRCARPPWLLPLRRWLTAAVTASNRFALGCGVLMLDYLATVEFNTVSFIQILDTAVRKKTVGRVTREQYVEIKRVNIRTKIKEGGKGKLQKLQQVRLSKGV